VLANERITYTWKEIDVFGETKSGDSSWPTQMAGRIKSCFRKEKREPTAKRHLLKNVNGVAKSGELLAILGSSGAGKTTLLNALSFRSPPGVKVSPTSIRAINGIPVTATELRVRCAYVQQDDLFIGSLTTKEHLMFQAMLRMDRNKTHKEKLQRVSDVLAELSLSRCANTLIGVPGKIKGLSGGERKRLAFASEALTDPHLLLCDEPTSGLDSFMAHNVLLVGNSSAGDFKELQN
jgi:ATP-binding cassette, subfamily G (WHITE), eye pigment precursor transporter